MKALLWKDFRLSQAILLSGPLLIVVPYLLTSGHTRMEAGWEISAFLSQFTLALLAGNIIACERADRSAEFLAFQGASRAMIIASKALLCLIVYLAVCSVMIVTRELVPQFDGQMPMQRSYVWSMQFGAAATGLAFWGCCWLLSSFLQGPVPAVMVGALAPGIVAFALDSNLRRMNWPIDSTADWWCLYGVTCATLGTISFVAGSWRYLSKLEP